MAKLQNPRHERFAQEIALGKNQAKAYRAVYGKHVLGSAQAGAVLMRKIDVFERVEELQAKYASQLALSADEMHSFLREAVETPAGKVTEKSRLCNEITLSPDGTKKLKIPDKLKALELSAKLQGMLGGNGAEGNKPHIRLQLIASGDKTAMQLDIGGSMDLPQMALPAMSRNAELDSM